MQRKERCVRAGERRAASRVLQSDSVALVSPVACAACDDRWCSYVHSLRSIARPLVSSLVAEKAGGLSEAVSQGAAEERGRLLQKRKKMQANKGLTQRTDATRADSRAQSKASAAPVQLAYCRLLASLASLVRGAPTRCRCSSYDQVCGADLRVPTVPPLAAPLVFRRSPLRFRSVVRQLATMSDMDMQMSGQGG